MNIGKIGAEGEKRVANFLRQQGFAVVKRNYACRYGEIDIIAENKELLLFVEVKTRKKGALVSGIDAVDALKQNRIALTANDYIAKTKNIKQPRFDIAEVTVYSRADGTTGYDLHYIKNAF